MTDISREDIVLEFQLHEAPTDTSVPHVGRSGEHIGICLPEWVHGGAIYPADKVRELACRLYVLCEEFDAIREMGRREIFDSLEKRRAATQVEKGVTGVDPRD